MAFTANTNTTLKNPQLLYSTSTNKVPKSQLIFVPIEPLAERYTESWYKNLPPLFEHYGFHVTTVDGIPLENEVKVGTFLDINSTTHYKFTQLQKISQMFHRSQIKHGCVFFFADTEFWGIESIRLLAQLNKIEVFITSFCHAASYTKEDAFAVAHYYQRYTEVGWFACQDLVFVGSHYHKQQIIKERLRPYGAKHLEDKIQVTRNPIFLDDYKDAFVDKWGERKQKKVLLTNRFDKEKRPNETLQLFKKLKLRLPDWEFVVTTGRSTFRGTEDTFLARTLAENGVITIKAGLTKAQYHQELSEAAIVVTHSIEENYGYCIVEAQLLGCQVVARSGMSHDELVPLVHRFDNQSVLDVQVMTALMNKFDSPDWPAVNYVDTSGADNIAVSLKRLVATSCIGHLL